MKRTIAMIATIVSAAAVTLSGATAAHAHFGLNPAGLRAAAARSVVAQQTAGKTKSLPTFSRYTTKKAITHCQNTTGKAMLTFDDGASPAAAKSILATLKSNNVLGAFFFTGDFARANPSIMRQIAAAGHIIGNHSSTHKALNSLSDAGLAKEITQGVRGNTRNMLLRPPYGAGVFDARVAKTASNHGYGLCYWTVDTRDWDNKNTKSAADIVRRVSVGDKWTPPLRKGGVVLMHGTAKFTPAALQGVIDVARKKGINLMPLS